MDFKNECRYAFILQFKFAIVANGRLTYITDEEYVMNLDELKTNGNPSMLLASWSYIIQYSQYCTAARVNTTAYLSTCHNHVKKRLG